MLAFRRAATLAHALPALRVRVRAGVSTVLDVGRPPPEDGPAIGPCAFRMAVARAHEQIKGGARLTFLGLPEDAALSVSIGVRAGDAALPGGIYRVAVDDHYLHAFATTLTPRRCRTVLDQRGDHVAGSPVRLHHDVATEVTVVHSLGPAGPLDPHRRDQLEDLLAGFAVDEVVDELARAGR
jgi:hypothetical protein